jgi:hypothetical protein
MASAPHAPRSRRWWPWRFSLRTLLLAMTLVCLTVGWLVFCTQNPAAAPRFHNSLNQQSWIGSTTSAQTSAGLWLDNAVAGF